MAEDLGIVQAGIIELYNDIAVKAEAEGRHDIANACRKITSAAGFLNNYLPPEGILDRITPELVPVKVTVGENTFDAIAEINPCYVLRSAGRLVAQIAGLA